ncbi:hypothetical protein LCGC14_0454930 [marine sediment metagenome]|uniref:Uncharacterized protein n=1 Tax=marine sediment metagenome TaxID=412755 RepID=A0A0F9SLU9_9ZZZZ
MLTVYQDGAIFYNDETWDKLFASDISVPNEDLVAARAARSQFEMWASRQGLEVEFSKRLVRKEKRDKFWAWIDPSIGGYSEAIDLLLWILNDQQLDELMDDIKQGES